MDPTHGSKAWRPCFPLHPAHHHHHNHCHFHSLCFCPHGHHHNLHLHHHHHHHLHHHQFNGRRHICPSFNTFPRNPEPSGPVPLPNDLNRCASGREEAYDYATPMLQEHNYEELKEEEDDDDDPVFVLTDEWREFFAKSEAKRKLEKKQAKKKGKK
ncbi:hypothetical protein F2P56_032062 [Juglans regia]|uniref:SKI/DACH domain-containing protein 1-like n=2 Tax=Juglans regia TaxID=51240 RepID=A0A833TTP4_JUGRE|nr:SKI/DACH domain-containing protein 1-like [Juglans regia]KAF5446434.1 hypothetical protein F2P56_032062 [Juglans regia]